MHETAVSELAAVSALAMVALLDTESSDDGSNETSDDDDDDIFLALSFTSLSEVLQIRKARLTMPDEIVSVHIDFDYFSEQAYDELFGFSKVDCVRLYGVLGVPEVVYINEGRHRFAVDGVKAFLYLLFRFRCPSQRQTLDSQRWGYDYSTLSKIFNAMLVWVDETHGGKLHCLGQMSIQRLAEYNAAITTTIKVMFPAYPLPPEAVNCSLFADGSRFKVRKYILFIACATRKVLFHIFYVRRLCR